MSCKHLSNKIDEVKVACIQEDGIEIWRDYYRCHLHKYCIPHYEPKNQILDRWNNKPESHMFKLCRLCSEHCPISHNEKSEK